MNNQTYGYARVSTKDQNEARQMIAFEALGILPENIFMDKQSGKDFNRQQYQLLVSLLQAGDMLIVTSLDRLGRNYEEMLEQWRFITKQKGADIRVLDMPMLDTTQGKELIETVITTIILQLSSYMSQNERDNIRKRQAEGIAAAKGRGVQFGRPASPVPQAFEENYQAWRDGIIDSHTFIERTGLSRSSFYRMVNKYEKYHRFY